MSTIKVRLVVSAATLVTIALVCYVLWAKSVFTVADMSRVIQKSPENYQDLALHYNEKLLFNKLPLESEIASDPLIFLSKYDGWLDNDPQLEVTKKDRAIVYWLNLFPAKSCMDLTVTSPDVVLFDEDLNIVAWRIRSCQK